MTALWTVSDMAAAMRATTSGTLPAEASGISIDSRTAAKGDAFFAIAGDNRDGHDFVDAALKAGAALAVVARNRKVQFAADAALLEVDDVLEALRDLARAARARVASAKVIAVTGSVGKTGTKEALKLALSPDGETHASAASYNNHWGVPLSLARCPATVKYAVFEIGMNHAGEITPLVKLVRPHIAIVTAIEPVHLEYFGSLAKIADAKAEIFSGIEPGGAAILNRDNAQYARLAAAAKAEKVARIVTFGENAKADARLLRNSLHPECSCVQASILGQEVTYKLGAPGKHLVLNSLAVLAAVSLAGADLALAALALDRLKPATGRGARMTLRLPGGTALLIDESYNANPASMAAAIALLGQAQIGLQKGGLQKGGAHGRRIAVLGDMLELGGEAEALHRGLAAPLAAANVDLVYCSGPAMRALWEALPSGRRGGYAETAAELEQAVLDAIRDGDAVMVKGSLGSKMGPIVKALERQFPKLAALEQSA
jgi:UDP-N-acetylmuramoyl-tripeptide--D-alanyl-D-alanine ligase